MSNSQELKKKKLPYNKVCAAEIFLDKLMCLNYTEQMYNICSIRYAVITDCGNDPAMMTSSGNAAAIVVTKKETERDDKSRLVCEKAVTRPEINLCGEYCSILRVCVAM